MGKIFTVSLIIFCVFVLSDASCRKPAPETAVTSPSPTLVPSKATAPTPYPKVHGSFDTVEGSYVGGWAAFAGKSSPATALIYVNGPDDSGAIFVGSVVADLPRPDVNSALGIEGPHGFHYLLPAHVKKGNIDVSLYDGSSHSLNIFVIDEITGKMVLLAGSPRAFRMATGHPPASFPR